MTTTSKRKPTAKQRTMQFYPNARLLFVQEGKKTVGYLVEPLDTPNAFQLMKPDGTVYNVQVNGNASLCDCIGFEHRGMNTRDGRGCKHIAAIATLQQLGRLPIDEQAKAAPQYVPSQFNDFDDP
jgi:hypothetical protein